MYNIKKFKNAIKAQLEWNNKVNVVKRDNKAVLQILCGKLTTEWIITDNEKEVNKYCCKFRRWLNQVKKEIAR